jgi:hypothetical protein
VFLLNTETNGDTPLHILTRKGELFFVSCAVAGTGGREAVKIKNARNKTPFDDINDERVSMTM